jgi:hypothetical protein
VSARKRDTGGVGLRAAEPVAGGVVKTTPRELKTPKVGCQLLGFFHDRGVATRNPVKPCEPALAERERPEAPSVEQAKVVRYKGFFAYPASFLIQRLCGFIGCCGG